MLKYVYSKMVNKAWLKEIGQESMKNKLHKAMLKLLIDQLMIAFIISPEIKALCMKEIAPQKREILRSVGDIIKKSLFTGEHYSALKNFTKLLMNLCSIQLKLS